MTGSSLGGEAVGMGIAVVHGLGFDPGGENAIADGVHTDIVAGNERLKLSRTVAEKIEAREMVGSEAADNRTDAAGRLVDHLAVLGLKGADRSGIAGDECWWHAEAAPADEERLIRLRIVG